MPREKNPWDIPEWHAIGREAKLVRHLVGSGITALGQANYADKSGQYYTAFFGLSVGLERLAKLILVADHAVSHNGHMPNEQIVRKFGHKLLNLTNAVDAITKKHKLKLDYPRPTTAISVKIIECLDAFADAGKARYANFVALGDPNLGQEEPIRKWWGEVAELILKEHYYGKQAQERVEGKAKAIDAMISPTRRYSTLTRPAMRCRTFRLPRSERDKLTSCSDLGGIMRSRWFVGLLMRFRPYPARPATRTILMRSLGSTSISKPIRSMTAF